MTRRRVDPAARTTGGSPTVGARRGRPTARLRPAAPEAVQSQPGRASVASSSAWLRPAVLASMLAAALLAADCAAPAGRSVTVVSWGGSYAQAITRAYLDPFAAATGIDVRLDDYNGGLAQIRAQVETGNIHWDVVDLEMADAVAGCDEGILEPLDVTMLAPGPDGAPAAEDFLPGTLAECGVGTTFYSTIVAWDAERLAGAPPATIDDFFDLERFPGRRGMRRVPFVNLEFALIADGVPLDGVYAALDTDAGLDRAFRKLDTIKDQVVWWEAGAQPPQMLADGEVAMSTAFNGRIFNAQVLEGQPFEIVWDGQVLDVGPIGIVAGTPDLEEALELVRFATRASSMAAVGSYIAYSPARRSGLPLIGRHADTGIDMHPHMPTDPANMARTLQYDWAWWSDHADDVSERFSAWLAR